jgi:hypothetical protein
VKVGAQVDLTCAKVGEASSANAASSSSAKNGLRNFTCDVGSDLIDELLRWDFTVNLCASAGGCFFQLRGFTASLTIRARASSCEGEGSV